MDQLPGGIVTIDSAMGGYPGITASYLIAAPRPCLVETGTARSVPTVLAALAGLGVEPGELASIVVTHIHLDHAGGVGDLAAAFPGAQVVVHEAGARHLADPSRLVASATRVFGADDMAVLFGPMRPVPAERLTVIGSRGSVDLGAGRTLAAFHAPGHATHHLGLVDSATGDLYVGDAAGIWVPEAGVLRPTTPPPDFDLALALDTLARFRAERPTRLLFSHFGPVADVAGILDRAGEELRCWVDLVGAARGDGLDLDHAVARVREQTAARYAALAADPEVAARIERLSPAAANVAGILRWLDREGAGPVNPPAG